jgi:nucleoside-diphosphate-sugar epimerase
MRILVTGATGFIGGHFLNTALAAHHEVFALRRPCSRPRVRLIAEPVWVDAQLDKVRASTLKGIESLVHFAAVGVSPQETTWAECFRWNVMASLRLCAEAIKAGVRRLVICGTCHEYGRVGERYDFIPPDAPLEPVGPYAASKAAASVALMGLARAMNSELVLLRPFNVYGEGQYEKNFWPALRKAALTGEDFEMTPGGQIRDFIPVEQVANRFVEALSESDANRGQPIIHNIGTGCPRMVLSFAKELWSLWGAKGQLLPGAKPYSRDEVMRYVPLVTFPSMECSSSGSPPDRSSGEGL